MLQELKVINFAIIENLHIHFRSGLNILSGETGAGKSVLLKSLGLLMGQKGSVESIRSGCSSASVEGCFDLSKRKDIRKKLEELGIDTEEQVLVVRRVLSEDKSRVYLNGTMSTLNALRDVVSPLIEVAGHSAPLIEMTGQHENRNLISKAYHLDLLDQYVGAWDTRLQYSEKFERMRAIEREITELEREAQHKAQRLDFLVFQRDEINGLELDPEADRDIETEIKKLRNSSRLSSFVDATEETLYSDDDSAVSRLKAILKKSFEVAQIDPGLEEKLKNLEQARGVIEDVVYDLRQYVSRIESDPGRLEELESRLSGMRKLQKKYGPSIDDIFTALKDIETEIKTLENSDQRILD